MSKIGTRVSQYGLLMETAINFPFLTKIFAFDCLPSKDHSYMERVYHVLTMEKYLPRYYDEGVSVICN